MKVGWNGLQQIKAIHSAILVSCTLTNCYDACKTEMLCRLTSQYLCIRGFRMFSWYGWPILTPKTETRGKDPGCTCNTWDQANVVGYIKGIAASGYTSNFSYSDPFKVNKSSPQDINTHLALSITTTRILASTGRNNADNQTYKVRRLRILLLVMACKPDIPNARCATTSKWNIAIANTKASRGSKKLVNPPPPCMCHMSPRSGSPADCLKALMNARRSHISGK